MASPFGSNLGPGEQWLTLPKPPKARKASSTRLPSVKAPTLKHLSTRSTMPKIAQGTADKPTASHLFSGSQSGSSDLFSGSSKGESVYSGLKFPKPSTLTPTEVLNIKRLQKAAAAKKADSHGGGISGFLGAAFDNPVGHELAKGLDLLSRPYHAAAAIGNATPGRDINPRDILHGFGNALGELEGHATQSHGKGKPMTHADAGDAKDESGTLLHYLANKGGNYHRLATGISGGLDIAVDPLNLVGGAGVWHDGSKAFSAIRGLSALDKAAAGAHDAASLDKAEEFARAAQELAPMQSKKLLEHIDVMKQHARDAEAKLLDPIHAEQAIADTEKMTLLTRTLDAEAKSNMARYLGLRIGTRNSPLLTLKTPIRTGLKLADRKALAEAKYIGAPVRALSHFKPGYLDPIGHSLEITAKHEAEKITIQSWKRAWHSIGRHMKDFSTHDQEDALAAVTHTPGMVGHESRVLNNALLTEKLTAAGFSGEKLTKAKSFIRSWHNVMDHIHEADARHGVDYRVQPKRDEIYVPHVVHKDVTNQIRSKANATTLGGTEKFGQDTKYSAMLAAAREGVKGKEIVTDPAQLLKFRIEKGAVNQTHAMVRQIIRETWGTAHREFSEERANKWAGIVDKLEGQRQELLHAQQASHHGRASAIMQAGKRKAAGYRAFTEREFVSKNKARQIERQYRKDVRVAEAHHYSPAQVEKRFNDAIKNSTKYRGAVRNKMIEKARAAREADTAAYQTAIRHVGSPKRLDEARAELLKAASNAGESTQRQTKQFLKEAEQRRTAAYRAAGDANKVVPKGRATELEQEYKDAVAKSHLQHSRTMDQTSGELDKLEGAIRRISDRRMKLNMVGVPKQKLAGLKQMDNLKVAIRSSTGKIIGYTHYSVPHDIHEQVGRVEKFMVNEQFRNDVMKHMAKAMQIWKFGVTVANPGYRVRNTISDMWNMFVDGVPAAAIPVYQSKAAKFQVALKLAEDKMAQGLRLTKPELETLKLGTQMHSHGILSGQFLGDVSHLVSKEQGRVRNPIKVARNAALTGNVHAENNTRIAHFMYLIDRNHSVNAAAERVRMSHFDYEDLTDTEKGIKNNLIPFYTWTRKNVPFQLKSLAENPARFNHAMMTMQGSESESGASPHDVIGHALDFAPTSFKLGSGYLNAQLGLSDVAGLGNPAQFIGGALTPALKIPIEAATGHNLETGDAISGPDATHARTPAPGWLAALLPGSGETARINAAGKTEHSPGINNWLAYALNELPASGALLATNKITKGKNATGLPGPLNNGRLLSYLTGVGYIKPKAGYEGVVASVEQADAEKKMLRDLRDSGKLKEPKYKKSHSYYQQLLDKYLSDSIQRGR